MTDNEDIAGPDIEQLEEIVDAATESGMVSEEDIALLEAVMQAAKALADEKQKAKDSLASEIEGVLKNRMHHRGQKESEWTTARDLFMGKLGTSRNVYMYPESVEQRGSPDTRIRVNIVRPKVEAVVSQLLSTQFGGGDKNWSLRTSKVPQTEDGVDPGAAISRMEDVIEDQLEQTEYARQCKMAMEDMAVLGTGVLKGPINSGKLKKVWIRQQDPMTGEIVRIPELTPEYIPCVKRVDPWFFYPDHTVARIEEANDAIQVHPMSKMELQKWLKHPAYDHEALEEVLSHGPKDFVAQRHSPPYTFLNSELFKDKYLVVERHGPIDRDCLCNMGVDLPFSDERHTYWGEVWVVNSKIIRIELSNLETADSVPYAVDVWEEDPSSIFGFGLPLLVEDQQKVAEGMWGVLVDNAKVSSGPQVGINRALIQPMKDGSHDIVPWKVWSINDYSANISQALQFHEVPNRQNELAAVLEMAKAFADEEASIPPLLGGMEAPQLTAGATGAAMVYKQATSMLHARAEQWDDNITKRVIGWVYDWNMQYGKDEAAKGDFEVDVRSSTSYLRQHMELINLEKLLAQAAQNPEVDACVKTDEIAKAIITNMQLPSAKLIRSSQEIAEYKQQKSQNQQPDPKMAAVEAKMKEVEAKMSMIGLEKQRLQFESTIAAHQAQMDQQALQESNDARIAEAQSKVLSEQLKRDTAMTQLAAKQGIEMAKVQADIQVKQRDQAIKEFELGIKTELDANKQALQREEMQLKRDTGSGV